MTSDARAAYGGFWRRFAAFVLVDFPLEIAAATAMGAGLGFVGGTAIGLFGLPEREGISLLSNLAAGVAVLLVWVYSAGLESSSYQATVGKMLFGMRVTDLEGRRIGFGRATARHFAKLLSGLFFGVGFWFIARSEKRQALHDDLTGTVVRRYAQGP